MTSIVRLVPAGPAAKSGAVKPTDKITAVGQRRTDDRYRWLAFGRRGRTDGPKGSTVQLQVVGADADKESSKRVTIVRNTIKLEEQVAQASH